MVGNTRMMNHYTMFPYKLNFVGLKLITPTQIDLVLTTHTRTLPHVQYFPQGTLRVACVALERHLTQTHVRTCTTHAHCSAECVCAYS